MHLIVDVWVDEVICQNISKLGQLLSIFVGPGMRADKLQDRRCQAVVPCRQDAPPVILGLRANEQLSEEPGSLSSRYLQVSSFSSR